MSENRRMQRNNLKNEIKQAKKNEAHWKKAWENGRVLIHKVSAERDAFNEEIKTLTVRLDAVYRMMFYIVGGLGGKIEIPKEALEDQNIGEYKLELKDDKVVYEIVKEVSDDVDGRGIDGENETKCNTCKEESKSEN